MGAVREHSVVKLRTTVEGWPGGTIGTVVSDYGDAMLVEVANDIIQVPVAKLELKR